MEKFYFKMSSFYMHLLLKRYKNDLISIGITEETGRPCLLTSTHIYEFQGFTDLTEFVIKALIL